MFDFVFRKFEYFANPEFFWLLTIIPLLTIWYIYKYNKNIPDIKLSSLKGFDNADKYSIKNILYHSLFLLRMIAIGLIIFALARPQSKSSMKDINVEGIDIVVTLDISQTMEAEDFKPNRIEAAKAVAMDFIDGRPNDRIGLVVFGSEAFTQCPITTDHAATKNLFQDVKIGMIEGATAIGDGLGTAVNRLMESKAKSKVIILLTDGRNNTGYIDPLTAAEIAKVYKIRVYTIGVGTYGKAPFPVITPFGKQYQYVDADIDEVLLKKVSEMTDGKYFRANNKTKLIEIYKEIDKLEKTKIEVSEYRKRSDEFMAFLIFALLLLTLEGVFRYTIFKSIP